MLKKLCFWQYNNSDYEIIDQKVFIKCDLLIENKSDVTKTFNLEAIFPEDEKSEFLKNANVYAFDEKGNYLELELNPKTSKRFEVTFVGDYGGYEKKIIEIYHILIL